MSLESMMPSNHLILCHPCLLLPLVILSMKISSQLENSQHFPVSQFFASGGQSIGVSASASVLPVNIQDWIPLGLAGWISLQSKGLSSLLRDHSSKASILYQNYLFRYFNFNEVQLICYYFIYLAFSVVDKSLLYPASSRFSPVLSCRVL